MTAPNFTPALAFAWLPQHDGQPYHVDAHDPGNGTAWAVTEATWADAQAHGLAPAGVALKDATQDMLGLILRVRYWNAIQGDALPSGVDLAVFDLAVLSGAGRAAMILQSVLGVTADGWIGPKTLAAAQAISAGVLVPEIVGAEMQFDASLNNATYFGGGWHNRARDVLTAALALVGGG
jgi:lysozyme family protein